MDSMRTTWFPVLAMLLMMVPGAYAAGQMMIQTYPYTYYGFVYSPNVPVVSVGFPATFNAFIYEGTGPYHGEAFLGRAYGFAGGNILVSNALTAQGQLADPAVCASGSANCWLALNQTSALPNGIVVYPEPDNGIWPTLTSGPNSGEGYASITVTGYSPTVMQVIVHYAAGDYSYYVTTQNANDIYGGWGVGFGPYDSAYSNQYQDCYYVPNSSGITCEGGQPNPISEYALSDFNFSASAPATNMTNSTANAANGSTIPSLTTIPQIGHVNASQYNASNETRTPNAMATTTTIRNEFSAGSNAIVTACGAQLVYIIKNMTCGGFTVSLNDFIGDAVDLMVYNGTGAVVNNATIMPGGSGTVYDNLSNGTDYMIHIHVFSAYSTQPGGYADQQNATFNVTVTKTVPKANVAPGAACTSFVMIYAINKNVSCMTFTLSYLGLSYPDNKAQFIVSNPFGGINDSTGSLYQYINLSAHSSVTLTKAYSNLSVYNVTVSVGNVSGNYNNPGPVQAMLNLTLTKAAPNYSNAVPTTTGGGGIIGAITQLIDDLLRSILRNY